MGWQRKPRWDASSRKWRCRVAGKTIYLGRDEATAWEKFNRLGLANANGVTVEPVTVAELIQQFSEPAKRRRWLLFPFADFAKAHALADVPPGIVADYVAWASSGADAYSAETIRNQVQLIMRAFRWGIDKGIKFTMPRKPALPTAKRMPRDYSRTDTVARLARCPPAFRRLMSFVVAVGCRPGEARALQWADVDIRAKVATLREHKTAGKTGAARTIYLTPAALNILAEIKTRRSGPVFLNAAKKAWSLAAVHSAARRAGIRPYSLRHTFAQFALEQGLTLEEVSRLLGHRSVATTQIYAQVRDQQAKAAAGRIRGVAG